MPENLYHGTCPALALLMAVVGILRIPEDCQSTLVGTAVWEAQQCWEQLHQQQQVWERECVCQEQQLTADTQEDLPFDHTNPFGDIRNPFDHQEAAGSDDTGEPDVV